MKLSNLEKAYTDAQAIRARLKEEIEAQTAEKDAAEVAAQEAADNGDIDAYRQHKAEAEELETSIFVKQAQLNKNGSSLKEEDVLKAWKKYAADYEKKFTKALSDYETARRGLYEKYMQVINLQNDALKTRERCGFLLGMKPPASIMEYDSHYKNFKMRTLPYTPAPGLMYKGLAITSPETVFFMSSGEANEGMVDFFNDVLKLHKAN